MIDVNEDLLLDTISAIYDASLDSDEWTRALDRVCQITNAVGYNIFLLDHQTGLVPFNTSVGIPDEVLSDYNAHYITIDPGANFYLEQPDLDCYYNYLHTSEKEIDKEEYYNWLEQAGGARYYLAKTFKIGSRLSVISTAQRDKKLGHAQQDDVDLLGKIGPHLQRAVQINQLFEDVDLRVAAAFDALENLPSGIFLFDRAGTIIYLNSSARKAIRITDGLILKRGHLEALHGDENATLQRLIGEVAKTGSGAGFEYGGVMAVSGSAEKNRYVLQVVPLGQNHDLLASKRPVGMIILGDPKRYVWLKREQLKALFDLTPAESEIALLLSQGFGQREICARQKISLNTLKTHRRSIFDKIGVRTQAELVHFLHTV